VRCLAVLLIVATLANAQQKRALASIHEPVAAFFGEQKGQPLPAALAQLKVPHFHSLQFVHAWSGAAEYFGWQRGNKVLIGLYDLRGPIDRAKPFDPKTLDASKMKPGALLAHWVAALQSGDGARAKECWEQLSKAPNVRTTIAVSIRRQWAHAAWHKDYAQLLHGCVQAIGIVGADEFHNVYVRRRLDYVGECSDHIPDLPLKTMSKRQQARYLVEGLRRMGPLWSCFAGTPPSFHGEPDTYHRLQKLGRAAYPDLVIAMADRRDAGRHLSAGGEGLPCTVGYVATNLMREMLGFECNEDLLERWVQSGAFENEKRSRAWFVANAREPQPLVFNLAHSDAASIDKDRLKALLLHKAPSVRLAAAARLGTPRALLATRKDAAELKAAAANFYYFRPNNAALRAWILAYVAHGPDPEKTIPALLADAPELKRIAYIEALAWLTNTNQAKSDFERTFERAFALHTCAPHLKDKSHNVALAAAWALHRLSDEAFASDHRDGLRMIELARKWAREQKLIR